MHPPSCPCLPHSLYSPPLHCLTASSTILSHTPSSNLQFSLSSSLSCEHVFHSAPSARFTSFALPPLQNETANRLAFLYRVKSREEKENRKSTEEISVLLLRNILPDHVAQHYIENGQQGAVSGRGEWVEPMWVVDRVDGADVDEWGRSDCVGVG